MNELEENELTFLREHRSAVFDCEFGTAFVSSDPERATWNFIGTLRPSFMTIPAAIERTVELFSDWKRTPCLKVTPMSRPAGWEAALDRAKWRPEVVLTHMTLSGPPPAGGGNVDVQPCTAEEDIETFSAVQSEAFGAPEWNVWVHKINLINHTRRHQVFYVARVDGDPAGVCLVVRTGTTAGLYAVATLPAHRGQGVARALVRRSVLDAREHGSDVICLNTLAGGPAETVFQRLGFERVFDSRFFTPMWHSPRSR